MAISKGKLTGVRAALAVLAIIFAFYGIMHLFFPRQFLNMVGLAQEPLTYALRTSLAFTGTLIICWVIAIGLALKNVLGSRSLVQAIIALLLIMGVVGIYVDFFVTKQAGQAIIDLLFIALGVLLILLYPWKKQAR